MKTEKLENERDEKAIRKIVSELHETWNRYDQEARAALFAEDADFTNVRGMRFHGRTEILEFHQSPLMIGMFKGSRSTPTEVKVRFIKSDVASADCRWEMTGSKYPDGSDWAFRKGLMGILLTKANEKWLIKVIYVMELPENA